MAGSVNKAIIVGNLGRDPEVRKLQSGQTVCNLSVATSSSYKDANGDRKSRTEWHRVVIWQSGDKGMATNAEKYLSKGSSVYLEGEIRTRKWEKDGVDRYSTEIHLAGYNGVLTFLDKANGNGNGDTSNDDGPAVPDDEEIPF